MGSILTQISDKPRENNERKDILESSFGLLNVMTTRSVDRKRIVFGGRLVFAS